MGEQFNQRYPNGTPLQGAAVQLSAQNAQGPYKPTVLSNGQPYQAPNYSQNPPTASFPNPQRQMYSYVNNPSPQNTIQPGPSPLRASFSPNQQPTYLQSMPQVTSRGPPVQDQPNPINQHINPPGVNYNGYRPSLPPASIPPGNRPPVPSYGTSNTGSNYGPPVQGNVAGHSPYRAQVPGAGLPGPPIGAPPPFDNKVPQHQIRPAAPQMPGSYPNSQAGLVSGMEQLSVAQQGFNKLWGLENIDLLQRMNILPPHKIVPPAIRFTHEFVNSVNCNQEIFCCTLNKIPENSSLLQKSRLPLGVLIHPFRDLTELPVIQCSSIVRCRSCRTYINPFVYFLDNKRWKCNLCFRVNELPDEFQFDPVSRTYGDPSRRPEIKSCTIEFIAPSEYMLRPPQPAIYLFLLDISRWACDSNYLSAVCDVLADELDSLPGDARTQVGFILYDSYLHFLSIPDGAVQARELIVTDIDDIFLPTPDSLLVNLQENKSAIRELLMELPKRFAQSFDIGCALGTALQAAHKLMSPTGGRVSVFQCSLPNKGPGSLSTRDSTGDSDKDAVKLNPQTDFYKRLALDCAQQQIAVDIFLLNSMYADLSTVGGIAQFSGGCIYHFPLLRAENVDASEKLTRALRRYLTRKIGFEAVMRVRCSRGLAIHTFHGNFFVRSTDLLSLPNVNPDAGFGMQITIEDSLSELNSVCFQAALLYTSAKGERRIRVHTLCLPVTANLTDILVSANQQAIIGLLSKMAVDRSLKANISDAREAFINASIDILSAYKLVDGGRGPGLIAPSNLALIPLYILALLKAVAFRSGSNTRLDDRMYAMLQMKNLPIREMIQTIHPDLYHVTTLNEEVDGSCNVVIPDRLSLSLQFIDSRGAYILDTPDAIYLLIGEGISAGFLADVLGVQDIRSLGADITDLPDVDSIANERLRAFINILQLEKPYPVVFKILTQPKQYAQFFVMDKTENALSYHELLNHIKCQVK